MKIKKKHEGFNKVSEVKKAREIEKGFSERV